MPSPKCAALRMQRALGKGGRSSGGGSRWENGTPAPPGGVGNPTSPWTPETRAGLSPMDELAAVCHGVDRKLI